MDLERLVDELWCGNHGLGDVSRFLLRALRNDESAAKAEFSKFLQGKLSDGLLKLSRRAVGKDGRPHRHGRSLGARGRIMNGSKQSATGDTSWPAEGAIGPCKAASTFAVRARSSLRRSQDLIRPTSRGGAREVQPSANSGSVSSKSFLQGG